MKKLSLKQILKEITFRKGPRTGTIELDEKSIENIKEAFFKALDEMEKYSKLIDKAGEGHAPTFPFTKHIKVKNPITGEKQKIIVNFKLVPQRDIPGMYNTRMKLVDLYIKKEDFNSKHNKKVLLSVLYHEITHALDPQAQQTKIKNKKDLTYVKNIDPDKRFIFDYVNSPNEIRAKSQELYQEIMRIFKDIDPQKRKKFKSKDVTSLIYQIHPFDDYPFIEYLTPETKKKFYKVAYNAFENLGLI